MLVRRAAKMADAETLMAWRNDPLTIQFSINSNKVYWESHIKWLKSVLNSKSKTIWIYEKQRRPVGTVREDFIESLAATELSWTVAPEDRGLGLGKKIVNHALGNLSTKIIHAKIKSDNKASLKIVESLGFEFYGEVQEGVELWIQKREP